jgi:putative ABC transport system ATP-binding protein
MLEVVDLKKSFTEPGGRRLPILDIPRLSLGRGEQMVLVGRSGGGKTTLLHIIAGITRPDSGTVTLENVELTRLSEAARDRVRAGSIGYVFQTFNLLPAFTALENVRLGMTFARGRHDAHRAQDLLVRVGLGDRLHHKPSALSVGQQQRVAVARALANRPKLLLADEPTANVDAANQQNIVDLLRGVCQDENVAMLLVTHSIDIASQFARVEKLDELNRVLQTKYA